MGMEAVVNRLDRYKTALDMIVRGDINRTLQHTGRPVTPVDKIHTDELAADWRLMSAYREIGVMVG